ncbi:MAG TPA: thioredoxin domain-containing protein [Polyangiaceae bacterium]
MNRLGKEASPYLLQHANNPVDWFPWGPEALEKAKREDKPILLSIGYSACHWCHVMEHESFENAATAAKMNELFVNVKVDREERPDLDQIYQMVIQIMGRSGGWPLTVFLTPEQKPFFAGTYFPPEDRYGMPGFPKILDAVADAYKTRRGELAEQAEEIAKAIGEVTASAAKKDAGAISEGTLERAAKKLEARMDDANGGFGNAPKFPNTMALEVVLRSVTTDRPAPIVAVGKALRAMRAGGIYDQLGGGFHRYSTDAHWLVPHFEKMLYDNALLVRLYVDFWRATKMDAFADTARDVCAWLLREMQDERGGFYATQDADSEGHEGKFFVWSKKEIEEVLGSNRDAEIFCDGFGVDEHGNFEKTTSSVLSIVKTDEELAADFEIPIADVRTSIAASKKKLFEAREKRVKPFRDEKVLTSWNGLVIASLADAGVALGDPKLVEAAERAFAFVEERLLQKGDDGHVRFFRHALGDVVKGASFLDDFAFVANAALALHEATGKARYATFAKDVAESMLAKFWDDASSTFYFSPNDGEKLIIRPIDAFDHAVPSATSIACHVLLVLGTLMDAKYTEIARRALERLAPSAIENPFGHAQSLCEIDRLVKGSVDVVIVGKSDDERTRALQKKAFQADLPRRTVVLVDPGDPESLAVAKELAEGKPGGDVPVTYVCRGRTCSLPITNADQLEEHLVTVWQA